MNKEIKEYGLKILAVDDDKDNLLAIKELVSLLGVDVLTASSAKEALSLLLHNNIVLAILDVNMPEMDGYELAKTIYSDKSKRSMPILFVTGEMTDLQSKHIGYEVGAIDYILKPVNEFILISKIKLFLNIAIERARNKKELLNDKRFEKKLIATNNLLSKKNKELNKQLLEIKNISEIEFSEILNDISTFQVKKSNFELENDIKTRITKLQCLISNLLKS